MYVIAQPINRLGDLIFCPPQSMRYTLSMHENLITSLDVRYENYKNLFRPGFLNGLKRFFLHPIKIILRKIQIKLIKDVFLLVQTETFFGYPMTIHSFEYCLWFAGCLSHTEVGLQKYIIKNFDTHGVFFDVGAHHGFYSLLAHRLIKLDNNLGQIHAFEPTDTHFDILKKNTKKFDSIFLNKNAVCASAGEKTFYENIKGKSTIEKNLFKNVPSSKPSDFTNIEVSCITLDTYCAEHNVKPTFIKIDVEGSEYEVLSGGKRVLREDGPIIAMEVWSKPYDNTNHIKAIKLLQENKYNAFKIDDYGSESLISYSDLIASLDSVGNSNNFIFKK